jgi:hypothetical protein
LRSGILMALPAQSLSRHPQPTNSHKLSSFLDNASCRKPGLDYILESRCDEALLYQPRGEPYEWVRTLARAGQPEIVGAAGQRN